MADDGNDILMQLCPEGRALPAECQTEVNSDDDSFVADYTNGTFFEVRSFAFGCTIGEQDATREKPAAGAAAAPLAGRTAPATLAGQMPGANAPLGPFARWKTATQADLATMKRYPVAMDDFQVTRDFDKASPVLFKACCDSASFRSASLVKRKVVGGSKLRGYLRLEFEDVLIKHIGWKNDDVMQETLKLVFRSLRVRYRTTALRRGQQAAVLEELPPVAWSYDAELVNRTISL